ncbi:hypothetical protein GALMADRAFT_1363946 [Galerina marginata CBS 339.88]|uniref:Uncharacterized protein n=1 Tax=Galerina marginata (strain CBS 339.88) TaxID=685588 RepID=A0A067T8Q1_GALM3|nr:hypothetical protein GALMADRAFT_1363946 [Galerina marginata CBS 339.88]
MVWHLVAKAAFSGFKVVATRAVAGKCAMCGAERLLVGSDCDEVCINSNCVLGLRDHNVRMRNRYLIACIEEEKYFKVRGELCGECKGPIVFFDLSPMGTKPRAYCINTTGRCFNGCLQGHFTVKWFGISREKQREAISYGHRCLYHCSKLELEIKWKEKKGGVWFFLVF